MRDGNPVTHAARMRSELLGSSENMRGVCDLVERVADTDITVLIRGESGAGKELGARAIHAASTRRDGPFVKVNCAALPSELLESELFGFERGAFAGAIQHKPGKFEFANEQIHVMGEVNAAGPQPLTGPLSILQALSAAGGFKDFAKTREIKVLRKTPNGTQTIQFDYKEAVRAGRAPLMLQAGDVVIVP